MSELRREYSAGRRLQRAETVRSVWSFVIPEDTPLEETFRIDFWRRAVEQLKPGDRVEVTTADHYTMYEITILASNAQSEPPRLDMVYRPIFPVDLKVPDPIVAPSRWRVKQRATDGAYIVFDSALGEVIADGLRREDAQQRVGLLEKLAREQDEAAKIPKVDKPGDYEAPPGWVVAEPAPIVVRTGVEK